MQIITHPTHSIRRLGMLVALNGISTGNSYASCQRNMLEIIPKENFLDTLSSADSLERARLRECNVEIFDSESGRFMVNKDRPTVIIFYDQLFSPDCQGMHKYFKTREVLRNSVCRVFACDSRDGNMLCLPRFVTPEYALLNEIATNALPYAGTDVFHGFVNDMMSVVFETYISTDTISEPGVMDWSCLPVHSDFGNSIWPEIQANRYCIAALEDWLFQRMEACAKKNTVSYTTKSLGRFTEATLHLYDSVY